MSISVTSTSIVMSVIRTTLFSSISNHDINYIYLYIFEKVREKRLQKYNKLNGMPHISIHFTRLLNKTYGQVGVY